jgi:formate dehydrogenase beta subunit
MAENAILYDSSKCSACKGCQVQCKQWNMLPSPLGKNTNEFTGTYQSMSALNGDTRLLITFAEKATDKGVEWAFMRKACFHCTDPACLPVCPKSAISKLDNGTVKLDSTKCIGCKYCNAACPFEVPKYRPNFGVSNKCTLCDDRVGQGLQPACVKTCPAHALFFGPRDEMLATGKARIEELKKEGFGKAELYGETEMGGMHVLSVAKYGYEAHGLIRDPKIPDLVSVFGVMKPVVALGAAALAGGLVVSFLTGLGYKVSDQDELAEPKTKMEEE